MVHKPLGLLAELTHRCPLGCPYCSNPLALDAREDELDTATWVRVFREARAMEAWYHPPLHGKLHRTTKILSHARRRGSMAARRAGTGLSVAADYDHRADHGWQRAVSGSQNRCLIPNCAATSFATEDAPCPYAATDSSLASSAIMSAFNDCALFSR
jgi:hypothetical protein